MKAWKAELLLFLVTFIWGATFLFTKLGLRDASPSTYLILRFSIALFICLIFFGKHLRYITRRNLLHGLILGLFFGAGFILQTYGLKLTSVSKSAFITGIAVVLTPFVYWFVRRKKVLIWQKTGVIIAAVGLFIFTNPEVGSINIGDFVTLLSTIFWALYITYMDVFTKEKEGFSETIQLVMLQFVASEFIALITLFGFEGSQFKFTLTPNLLISLAYNGIVASFFLTLIHTSVQRYTTPVKAALIFSVEPIFASFIALVVLNEILSLREYTGAIILFSGVIISEAGEFITDKLKSRSKN